MAERKTGAPSSRPPRVVVTVRRSGGFAGMTRSWTADSAALEGDAAQRLVALAASAVLQPPPASGSGTGSDGPTVADAFAYEVTVKVGRAATRRLRCSETDAADDVKALIAHVRDVGSA